MPIDLLRWSLSALVAEDALNVLQSNAAAAPAWSTALEGILAADPRQRDSVWAMVGNAFSALSDPAVLEAVSPHPEEALDPEVLLRQRGSLFLIGTSVGASATATLVSALIEDVVETARAMAARSPGARLETPLSLVLDEAANYPLPSLLPLMSEGGGSGISTMAVVQSLAQARARWGRDAAAAIWDAAIVKVVLGGGAGSEDLRDLSAILGVRERRRTSQSWGDHGSRSRSVSTDEHPVYDVNALRTLPFGRAILLLRSAPPIDLRLQPWTRRKDAGLLRSSRSEVECLLRTSDAVAA
jgi:type IV secretory pathway TraG/TraD family ATPase VirD4